MKKQFQNWIIPIAMVVIVILGIVLVVVLKSGVISKDSLFGKALYTTVAKKTTETFDSTVALTVQICESFDTYSDSENRDKTPLQICANAGKYHIETRLYHWTGTYLQPSLWEETLALSNIDESDYYITICCDSPGEGTTSGVKGPHLIH